MSRSTSTPETARTARLDEAIQALARADAVDRPRRARQVLSLVPTVLKESGPAALAEVAAAFDQAGGFTGTPWDRPARLRPRLWAGSFAADPPYPWTETMSTLRMLAIARGEAAHEDVDQDHAMMFLERVLALNIDKVLGRGSEVERMNRVRHHEAATAVLSHVLSSLRAVDVLKGVAEEIDAIMAQRPVWTHRVRATLRMVAVIPGADEADSPLLDRYVEAVLGPSPMSMRFRDPEDYAEALTDDDLESECQAMGARLRETGLACPQLTALLHHVADQPARLADALGLDDQGRSAMEQHHELVKEFLQTIVPGAEQTAYGLARCLERGILGRPEVVAGLKRLLRLDLSAHADRLLATIHGDLTPQQILMGGLLRILGQPLGVGQGNNPTCQAARGISLWAQYRPAHLIEALIEAADGDLALPFEGQILHSKDLLGGLAPTLDPELDPVSLILVPHLDRLYDTLMRLAGGRGADPHQWANPALYGRIVPPGFRSCFDPLTWQVADHEGFLRTFYATFHPEHNEKQPPVYATPVGITVTDDRARLLGLHAVTLQRVARRGDTMRAYFYNPNDEGRQDWGDGVRPTVRDHGEQEGESSLPFDHFASRIYAFHHPLIIPGDPLAVPAERMQQVSTMARKSWGRAYVWPR